MFIALFFYVVAKKTLLSSAGMYVMEFKLLCQFID